MAHFFASPKLQTFISEVRNELRPSFLAVPSSRSEKRDDETPMMTLLDEESAAPAQRQSSLSSAASNSFRMLPVVRDLDEWRVVESQKESLSGTMTLDQYDQRLGKFALAAVAFLLGLILVMVFSAWYLTIE